MRPEKAYEKEVGVEGSKMRTRERRMFGEKCLKGQGKTTDRVLNKATRGNGQSGPRTSGPEKWC